MKKQRWIKLRRIKKTYGNCTPKINNDIDRLKMVISNGTIVQLLSFKED